jgi:manganese/zinc/iron transport system permease protein
MRLLEALLFDYTLRTIALGSLVLGAVSGVLGCFAVLRRQSLLGDTVSHAALPGIVLAFMVSGSKAPLALMIGAATAGWIGTLLLLVVVRHSRIKEDGALALLLSVFFGLGLMLLTFLQRHPDSSQAGLDRFLFGQAAGLLASDVIALAAVGALLLVLVLLFWKGFKLVTFDPGFAASIGLPVRALELAITWLMVLAIVLGLQTVGVVLMSAMLIAPAVAARQWTDRLGRMVALAALFGALAGVGGALLSGAVEKLPAGPTIVLGASAIAVLSVLFAPHRGLLWRRLRERRARHGLALDGVLADLYALGREHDEPTHAHAARMLELLARPGTNVRRSLAELLARGLVVGAADDRFALTPEGAERAAALGTREEAES